MPSAREGCLERPKKRYDQVPYVLRLGRGAQHQRAAETARGKCVIRMRADVGKYSASEPFESMQHVYDKDGPTLSSVPFFTPRYGSSAINASSCMTPFEYTAVRVSSRLPPHKSENRPPASSTMIDGAA